MTTNSSKPKCGNAVQFDGFEGSFVTAQLRCWHGSTLRIHLVSFCTLWRLILHTIFQWNRSCFNKITSIIKQYRTLQNKNEVQVPLLYLNNVRILLKWECIVMLTKWFATFFLQSEFKVTVEIRVYRIFRLPSRCVQMFPVSVWILKMLLKQARNEGMGGLWPWSRKSLSFSQSGSTSWGMTRHRPSHTSLVNKGQSGKNKSDLNGRCCWLSDKQYQGHLKWINWSLIWLKKETDFSPLIHFTNVRPAGCNFSSLSVWVWILVQTSVVHTAAADGSSLNAGLLLHK